MVSSAAIGGAFGLAPHGRGAGQSLALMLARMFSDPADAFDLFKGQLLRELDAAAFTADPADRAKNLDLGKAHQRRCADARRLDEF